MDENHERRVAIAHLAGRQHGHVARRQLLALDVPATTVDTWVARGRLIVVHAGVYAVGYLRVEPIARAAAAVLACGPDAALSHDSAAALWGLRRWPAMPEVIARRARRPGIRAHRSTTLTPGQVTRQLGIRTTTTARTIADLTPRLTTLQRTRMINDARLKRTLGADDACRLLGDDEAPTRSEFEDAFRRFVARYRLPRPQINTTVDGYEVDVLFPDHKLIVELDGYDSHRDRASFESDRERDAAHALSGHLTIRVTWVRLIGRSEREAARLARILEQRAPPP